MKQYLLSVHHDGDFPTPEPEVMQQMFEAVEAFNAELQATVRYEQGRTQRSEGPWSRSQEQLGGFWVIQAEDLDGALEIAERAATACRGDVEVRPFQGE